MMTHRHSFFPCCNGPPLICSSPAMVGTPAAAEEASPSLAASNLPLVPVAVQSSNSMLHLHPCGCMAHSGAGMHESLYLHLHPHTHFPQQESLHAGMPGMQISALPYQVQAPEPLYMELPGADSVPLVRSQSHTMHYPYACGHQHPQKALALPMPDKSQDLTRKFGSDACGLVPQVCGSVLLPLNKSVVLDAQPLAMCRNVGAICDKAHSTAMHNVHERVLCSAPSRHLYKKLPALTECGQAGSKVCHQQSKVCDHVQTCQIHPHCVAPGLGSSANLSFKDGKHVKGFCQTASPCLQALPRAARDVATASEKVTSVNNLEEPAFAEAGNKTNDEFWMGATHNSTQVGRGDDASKGGSYGKGKHIGNGWRGGSNARGRGANNRSCWNNNQEDNGGEEEMEPRMDRMDNARGGRGCRQGRGRGGWQQNKWRKESNDDFEGFKPNAACGQVNGDSAGDTGWGNLNNSRANNNCNGW